MLRERPEAGLGAVARAAGVTRTTLYAHFPSREVLVEALLERALAEAVARVDAAHPEEGDAAEALLRVVDVAWSVVEAHGRLHEAVGRDLGAERGHQLHGVLAERLIPLLRRGQREGRFDPEADPAWLAAAFFGIVHAAAAEVGGGRLTPEAARHGVRRAALGAARMRG